MRPLPLPLLRLSLIVGSKLNGSRHGLDQVLPRPLYVLCSYLPFIYASCPPLGLVIVRMSPPTFLYFICLTRLWKYSEP